MFFSGCHFNIRLLLYSSYYKIYLIFLILKYYNIKIYLILYLTSISTAIYDNIFEILYIFIICIIYYIYIYMYTYYTYYKYIKLYN